MNHLTCTLPVACLVSLSLLSLLLFIIGAAFYLPTLSWQTVEGIVVSTEKEGCESRSEGGICYYDSITVSYNVTSITYNLTTCNWHALFQYCGTTLDLGTRYKISYNPNYPIDSTDYGNRIGLKWMTIISGSLLAISLLASVVQCIFYLSSYHKRNILVV